MCLLTTVAQAFQIYGERVAQSRAVGEVFNRLERNGDTTHGVEFALQANSWCKKSGATWVTCDASVIKSPVPICPEKDGYAGRECPKCECYFKVAPREPASSPATRLPLPSAATKGALAFSTNGQIQYAKSVAFNRIASGHP